MALIPEEININCNLKTNDATLAMIIRAPLNTQQFGSWFPLPLLFPLPYSGKNLARDLKSEEVPPFTTAVV